MATIRSTTIGAYVEVEPDAAVRATQVGALVEYESGSGVRVTSIGALVEYLEKQKTTPGPPPPKPPKPPNPNKISYRDPIGSLAAWWPANLSFGSKMLSDVIGNNDAAMQGTVPWSNDGKFNISVALNGNSANYFNANSGRGICDGNMSIAVWVSFDDLSTTLNDTEIIIARSKNGNDSYAFGVKCYSAGAWPRVLWLVNGVDMFSGSGPEIKDELIYHIVVTGTNGKDPGTWDLFVDGIWHYTSPGSGAIGFNSTDTYIGRREWVGSEGPMDGRIYDLRIYNRPLTPQEVASLYNPFTRWLLGSLNYGYFENYPSGQPTALAGAMALKGLSGLSALMGQ